MGIKQVKRILEISQEIINLADKNNWSEAELVEAINLLSSKTKDEIDNKKAAKDLI